MVCLSCAFETPSTKIASMKADRDESISMDYVYTPSESCAWSTNVAATTQDSAVSDIFAQSDFTKKGKSKGLSLSCVNRLVPRSISEPITERLITSIGVIHLGHETMSTTIL